MNIEQQAEQGIKEREELDSIFKKYPFEVEMDAANNNIEITLREPDITEVAKIPMELLHKLINSGYMVKSISSEIEDVLGETFAVLKIVIGWKNE